MKLLSPLSLNRLISLAHCFPSIIFSLVSYLIVWSTEGPVSRSTIYSAFNSNRDLLTQNGTNAVYDNSYVNDVKASAGKIR